jgi:serine/threonine protein kinase
MTIKLSDLGSGKCLDLLLHHSGLQADLAFWEKSPPPSTVTPVTLRAPELIFKEMYNSSINIWAFGCLIYEFLIGTQLFSAVLMGDDDQKTPMTTIS